MSHTFKRGWQFPFKYAIPSSAFRIKYVIKTHRWHLSWLRIESAPLLLMDLLRSRHLSLRPSPPYYPGVHAQCPAGCKPLGPAPSHTPNALRGQRYLPAILRFPSQIPRWTPGNPILAKHQGPNCKTVLIRYKENSKLLLLSQWPTYSIAYYPTP